MKCSNCGKDVPFAEFVCPYCHAYNKYQDHSLNCGAWFGGTVCALLAGLVTHWNILYMFGAMCAGMMVVIMLIIIARAARPKPVSPVMPNSPVIVIRYPATHRLVLVHCGPQKIGVIKVLREELGYGLVEAKNLSETPNSNITDWIDADRATRIQQRLEKLGAVVTIVQKSEKGESAA